MVRNGQLPGKPTDQAIGALLLAAVRKETVASIAVNSVLAAAIGWLLDLPPPQMLWGQAGVLAALLPTALMPTLMMSIALTLQVHARVRKGLVPSLHWLRDDHAWLSWPPRRLAPRAIALAVLAALVLVPLGLLVVSLLGALPLTRTGFFVCNMTFGAIVGLVMTPIVVLLALADPSGTNKVRESG